MTKRDQGGRLGRVTRETDPKQHDRTYGYDAAGNLTSQTDRLGQVRTFDFDNLNRLTAEKWLNSSAAVTRTLSWDYDLSGLLVNTDDRLASGSALASAEYDYHYDAAGRLDKSLSTIAGLSKEIQQTHTRDPLGRRTGLAVDLVTGFDSADWSVDTTVAEHTNAYTYDHLNQLTRVTQSGGVSGNAGVAAKRVDLEYDNAGRNTKVKRRDGLADSAAIVAETTTTYTTGNAAGKVAKIETTNSSSQVIARDTYTYDFAFFRTSTFKTGVGAAEHTTTYQYDATGQLLSADDNATTAVDEDYVWDLNGNRKNKKDKVNTGNQLTSDGAYDYTYDAEGNLLTTKVHNSSQVVSTNEWDYRQRLTKVTFKDAGGATTKTVAYVYDGFDRRLSNTVTDYVSGVAQTPITEIYLYDEGAKERGNILLDFVDSDGVGGNAPAISKRYLWNDAVDQIFAQEDVSKTLNGNDRFEWFVQDRLGSVRTLLDRTGAVTANIDYTSFGEIKSVKDASGNATALTTRFTFTAQELDTNTGDLWYSNGSGRGRPLRPSLGRFLQPDELGFAAGDMNLYRYVGNSTTNATDPSGQRKTWGYWFQNHWDNWGKWVAIPDLSIGIAIGTSHDPVEAAKEVARGFKTGTKAVVNGVAIAAVKTVTLGTCGDGLELIGVTDKDRELGYDTAVQFSTASGEILIGVASGNAAAILKNGGILARAASGGLNILDAAGNVVGVVKGVYDASTNGINLSNGLQIAGSLLGLAGNAKGLANGVDAPSAPKPKKPNSAPDATSSTACGPKGARQWRRQEQQVQQQQGNGSYTNRHESGKTYSGKGDETRMKDSAKRIESQHNDPVVSQEPKPAADTKQSFIDEQNQIEANGGPGGNTYNKINSPGKKLRDNE